MNTTVNLLQHRMNDIQENPHLLMFYAKSSCRDCYGRGTRTHNTPNGTGQWVERTSLCPCVKKAVQKEVMELAETDG